MTLELVRYIQKNPLNYASLLRKAPHYVLAKREGDYVLFMYTGSTKFTHRLECECRGIILYIPELPNHVLDSSPSIPVPIPVCVPFFKFGNFFENYIPEIDWKSTIVQEKIDGSIIKLWYHNGLWRISSNTVVVNVKYEALFEAAKGPLDYTKLDKNYTYIFELIGPSNFVKINYPTDTILHIGARHNITLEEADLDIGVPKPRRFPDLHTVEDCNRSIAEREKSEEGLFEGYVIVDKFWNRVKVKSQKYIDAPINPEYLLSYSDTLPLKEINRRIVFGTADDIRDAKGLVEGQRVKIGRLLDAVETVKEKLSSERYENKKDLAFDVRKAGGMKFISYFLLWNEKRDLEYISYLQTIPEGNPMWSTMVKDEK